MLYGSEAWCLNESEMGILRMMERSMLRATFGVQIKNKKYLWIVFACCVRMKS